MYITKNIIKKKLGYVASHKKKFNKMNQHFVWVSIIVWAIMKSESTVVVFKTFILKSSTYNSN